MIFTFSSAKCYINHLEDCMLITLELHYLHRFSPLVKTTFWLWSIGENFISIHFQGQDLKVFQSLSFCAASLICINVKVLFYVASPIYFYTFGRRKLYLLFPSPYAVIKAEPQGPRVGNKLFRKNSLVLLK